jgi:hypothetical protein
LNGLIVCLLGLIDCLSRLINCLSRLIDCLTRLTETAGFDRQRLGQAPVRLSGQCLSGRHRGTLLPGARPLADFAVRSDKGRPFW